MFDFSWCCHFIIVPKLLVLENHKFGASEQVGKIKSNSFLTKVRLTGLKRE